MAEIFRGRGEKMTMLEVLLELAESLYIADRQLESYAKLVEKHKLAELPVHLDNALYERACINWFFLHITCMAVEKNLISREAMLEAILQQKGEAPRWAHDGLDRGAKRIDRLFTEHASCWADLEKELIGARVEWTPPKPESKGD